MFLDPVIAITAPKEGFWTPNGRHRLEAMRRLGAKSIIALVVPKREIAWQILALNTEKAHNLRERSLEVIRIYKGLIDEDPRRPESDFSFYLEEAALVTLGPVLRAQGQFRRRRVSLDPAAPGGVLHRAAAASRWRCTRSMPTQLFELDELVTEVVDKLKERGLVSPYLRAFVVARINPLRWIKDEPPPLAEVLKTMKERLAKFNVDKINQQDLARTGGAPDTE